MKKCFLQISVEPRRETDMVYFTGTIWEAKQQDFDRKLDFAPAQEC